MPSAIASLWHVNADVCAGLSIHGRAHAWQRGPIGTRPAWRGAGEIRTKCVQNHFFFSVLFFIFFIYIFPCFSALFPHACMTARIETDMHRHSIFLFSFFSPFDLSGCTALQTLFFSFFFFFSFPFFTLSLLFFSSRSLLHESAARPDIIFLLEIFWVFFPTSSSDFLPQVASVNKKFHCKRRRQKLQSSNCKHPKQALPPQLTRNPLVHCGIKTLLFIFICIFAEFSVLCCAVHGRGVRPHGSLCSHSIGPPPGCTLLALPSL